MGHGVGSNDRGPCRQRRSSSLSLFLPPLPSTSSSSSSVEGSAATFLLAARSLVFYSYISASFYPSSEASLHRRCPPSSLPLSASFHLAIRSSIYPISVYHPRADIARLPPFPSSAIPLILPCRSLPFVRRSSIGRISAFEYFLPTRAHRAGMDLCVVYGR